MLYLVDNVIKSKIKIGYVIIKRLDNSYKIIFKY